MRRDAHLRAPFRPDALLVEECDEVLARGDLTPEVRDAWLDARNLAKQAEAFYGAMEDG
jgi:hypothetical protein